MEMFLPLPRRVAKHSIRLQPTSHALPEEEDVVRNENKREFHSERTMRIFADYYLERLLRRLLLPSLTAGVLTITCCKCATFICLTFNCCSAETRPASSSLLATRRTSADDRKKPHNRVEDPSTIRLSNKWEYRSFYKL